MGFADGYSSGFSVAANKKAQREALAMQKLQMDRELQKSGYNPNDMSIIPGSTADVERAQNEQTLAALNALNGKLAAQDSDQAILDYSDTGDANYLQAALDKNPLLKQAWSQRGVQNITNLDWGNDSNLLASVGIEPHEYDTPYKQDTLKKKYLQVL